MVRRPSKEIIAEDVYIAFMPQQPLGSILSEESNFPVPVTPTETASTEYLLYKGNDESIINYLEKNSSQVTHLGTVYAPHNKLLDSVKVPSKGIRVKKDIVKKKVTSLKKEVAKEIQEDSVEYSEIERRIEELKSWEDHPLLSESKPTLNKPTVNSLLLLHYDGWVHDDDLSASGLDTLKGYNMIESFDVDGYSFSKLTDFGNEMQGYVLSKLKLKKKAVKKPETPPPQEPEKKRIGRPPGKTKKKVTKKKKKKRK